MSASVSETLSAVTPAASQQQAEGVDTDMTLATCESWTWSPTTTRATIDHDSVDWQLTTALCHLT
ncbi:hypothetical protein ABZ614_22120 [Streptomyces sp. NPDC013178]|uniref:hypothetical protein n=1 Tax=unclassified Streptomyces TaxID=2593676 RepID=UPI00340601AB